MAVMLMGDKEDYRKSAIQKFTAPYYIAETRHYENATSLMLIGDTECTLLKGPNKIKIKIRPEPADVTLKENYYCKMGYSKLDETEQKDARLALRNNEYIRVHGCDKPYLFDKKEFAKRLAMLESDKGRLEANGGPTEKLKTALTSVINKRKEPLTKLLSETKDKLKQVNEGDG